MRRILTAVIAVILVWLVLPVSAVTATAPGHMTMTYTYDSHHHDSLAIHTTAERGPPVAYDHAVPTYDTVDRRSHGASARPVPVEPQPIRRCDQPPPLAQVAGAASTTATVAENAWPNPAHLARSSVAAEGAAGAADDWPVISGIVRDATRSKGNFGLGEGSLSQATRAGESWVGDGYRVASDGKTLVSRDGLRTFRPPTWKPNLGKYQAVLPPGFRSISSVVARYFESACGGV